ncbi:MAG: HlyD family secretion protein [Alphaproteobacteria bacterium]
MTETSEPNGSLGLTPVARGRHVSHFDAIKAVRTPLLTRAFALMIIAAIVIVGLFLYFVPWIQTTSGFGTVTALDPRDRAQEISVLVSGRIQEWYVRDGSRVSQGDPIVRIVDNDPNLVERLTAEREALAQQLEAAKTATRTALLDFDRKKRLFDQGLTSRLEFETAQIRLEDLRSKEAAAEAALNRADVSISRQSTQVVRAPRNGTILSVTAGDTSTFVREGQSVATFLPDGVERAVELFIDGRDIALVVPGRKVRLQFEGWPAVQFSGWPSVAIGTFGGEVAFVDPSASARGRFRILVVPDPDAPEEEAWPEERFIRFGSQARGWVLLDEVRVGFELWRQMNNFPPNLPSITGQEGGGNGGG